MEKNKKIMGIYNHLYYYIDLVTEDGPKTLYRAGNSPFGSQIYVPANEGVGVEKMREYCLQTATAYAEENDCEVYDLVYEDWNDEDEAAQEARF
jgi:hypothetical protein